MKCINVPGSTVAGTSLVVVLVVVVILVRYSGYTPDDVHQLLSDLVALIGLTAGLARIRAPRAEY